MKSISRLVVGAAALVGLSSTTHAQRVTPVAEAVNPCLGMPLSTHQSWLALLGPERCSRGDDSPTSTREGASFVRAGDDVSWLFVNSPVAFNNTGLRGWGTPFVQRLSGESAVRSSGASLDDRSLQVRTGTPAQPDRVGAQLFSDTRAGVDDLPRPGAHLPSHDPMMVVDGRPVSSANARANALVYGRVNAIVYESSADLELASVLLVASAMGGLGALVRRQLRRQATT